MSRVVLLYVLWLGCLRLNAQWLVLQLPTTENLRSVAFCNADTGFVISALSIYRTTDGGSSWGVVANAPPPHRLYDISVPKFSLTKQTIYAVGGYMFFDFSNQTQDVGNVILKSTDFGATWQTTLDAQDIGESQLDYVYALTDSVAFVMGSQGPFIPNNNFKKTTNGGLSWFAMQSGFMQTPYGGGNVDFINMQLGYGTWTSSAVRKTTNQGESWSILAVFPLVKNDFTDTTTGYVISDGIKKTSDGGATWVQTNDSLIFPPNLTDMTFPERDIGFLSGLNGSLFKTTNGFDWIALQPPTNQSFFRLTFLNSLVGYIAGSGGVVFS